LKAPLAFRLRLSVFVTILSLFTAVVLLTGTAITVGNYAQTRQAAFEVASGALDNTVRRVNERHTAFFNPVISLADQYSVDPRVVAGGSDIDDIFLPLLRALQRNPQISGIYAGYETGEFYQVLSFSERDENTVAILGGPPGARYALQTIRLVESGARLETWRFFDADQTVVASLVNAAPTYDPRARGWYKDARTKRIVRTAPYVFAATPQVGMTVGVAFDGPIGGVVAVDVTLDRLSGFLEEIRPNHRHHLMAFDDGGGLIAHPDPDRVLKRTGSGSDLTLEPASIFDLDEPVIQAAARRYRESGGFSLESIRVDGEAYLASAVFQDNGFQGHYILYAAPRSEFEGSLAGAATRSIIPGLIVILLASPAIIYLARLISSPLARLSHEAETIRAFNLDSRIDMKSPVREIDALIGSMAGMKNTLREISKFVPKAHVRGILASGKQVAVGGEKRRLSLLFTDVKDFTPISDSTPPEQLLTIMSEYFEELVSLIIQEGGTVDKFVGDAIFAYWNAPAPTENHEHAACIAALRCRNTSMRLGARWLAAGRTPWHTRFGVHVGETVVGNVGASDRIDYTVIGSTVNIASRLEGLNKFYGTQILASGQIVAACGDAFLFRRLDYSLPKGAILPLEIYELLGAYDGPARLRVTPEQEKRVTDWNVAYAVYLRRDWLRALDAMEAFLTAYPDDGVAKIYLDRIVEFLVESPPSDWDGIMRFSAK